MSRFDLVSDFAQAYDDFGLDAFLNGTDTIIRVLRDEAFEFDDSTVEEVTVMKPTVVKRKDTLTIDGITYKVMKDPVPYGDQREEFLFSLVEVDNG